MLLGPSLLYALLVDKRGQRCFCNSHYLLMLIQKQEDVAQSEQPKGACRASALLSCLRMQPGALSEAECLRVTLECCALPDLVSYFAEDFRAS